MEETTGAGREDLKHLLLFKKKHTIQVKLGWDWRSEGSGFREGTQTLG